MSTSIAIVRKRRLGGDGERAESLRPPSQTEVLHMYMGMYMYMLLYMLLYMYMYMLLYML